MSGLHLMTLIQPMDRESVLVPAKSSPPAGPPSGVLRRGRLIINADDWGRDQQTTDRISECALRGTVSSVSAMVFMEDSERAAVLARESAIDAGLHLNFTTPFSSKKCPQPLLEKQQKIAVYLRRHALTQAIFNPLLAGCFEYVVNVQVEEYTRLYGKAPARLDGHHHMHLCANVVMGGLLPRGTVVRRNFSFQPGEKSWLNRLYRNVGDRLLQRRHLLTDYFFSLTPLEPAARLRQIFSLTNECVVEVETHPANPEEHRFLTEGDIYRVARDVSIAPRFALPGVDGRQQGNL